MKFLPKPLLIVGLFVLPTLAVYAQSGPASVSIALQMQTGRAYKMGSPYCAMKEYVPARTPTDGTKVAHTERVCRDSLGRGGVELAEHLVEIYDPVEGFAFTLDTAHGRAGRTAIRRSSDSGTSPASFTPRGSSPAVELLGTQVIEGLVVEGTRRPTVLELLAKGEEEIWFSQELGEVIVMKRSDGLVGSTPLWQLTDINRSEPDPSLFRVPAN
jgi:hypothetical protein